MSQPKMTTKTNTPTKSERAREILADIRSQDNGRAARTFDISTRDDAVNEEERTFEIALSSEEPYERWWGIEILDHSPGSIRMERITNGAPFLLNHNYRNADYHIGVIQKAWIGNDRVLRALVKLSSSDRAGEIFRDILDGIRTKVSVGYEIHHLVLEEVDVDTNKETLRCDDWEPLEGSLVSVPADDSVGVGRSVAGAPSGEKPKPKARGKTVMEGEEVTELSPEQKRELQREAAEAARKEEQERVRRIMALGSSYDCEELAIKHVQEGTPYDEFIERVLPEFREEQRKLEDEKKQQRGATVRDNQRAAGEGRGDGARTAIGPGTGNEGDDIGLSRDEIREYSITRALEGMITKNRDEAPFEFKVSDALSERRDNPARGLLVPREVQAAWAQRSVDRRFGRMRDQMGNGRAAMQLLERILARDIDTAGPGASLVGVEHRDDLYIDALRPFSIAMQLGVTMLPGLIQNQSIPKKTGVGGFSWIAEGGNAPLTDLNWGAVSLQPKTLAGGAAVTRRMLQQGLPAVEALIEQDLMEGEAEALDRAVFEGSGVGEEPTGVVNSNGVNLVTLATAGDPTWAEVTRGFWQSIAVSNAMRQQGMGWVFGHTTAANLMNQQKDPGSGRFLLENFDDPLLFPQMQSNQLSANRIILGYWPDVMVGQWGELDLVPDQATLAASGGLVIRLFRDADVTLRHGESFATNG
ncbi:MAG: phage major capsid protein [Pseudomonadota bacterium]